MAIALQDRKRVTTGLKSWLDDIAAYDREFQKWGSRVEKILKRYRDEARMAGDNDSARLNILWSNVQTLMAATYSRVPKPDVSRRFRDNDPVGRVASLILERGLDYHIQHYSSYRTTLKGDVLDRFLGGRGTAWVRYEPYFKTGQVTEDVDGEELDYECAEVDYVHWKDFGHSVARTWEEVSRVWRKVYMTKEALVERFGEEKAKLIPMDADPMKETNRDVQVTDAVDRACVYEGWDKNERKAVWFSKSVKDFLDERPDPLKLEEFFPCPRPITSTLTNDTLVPVPDFTLYQDQARELDILADRKDGLIKALQVKGVYDGSLGVEIARIFTEGQNNTLIPVKNWQAFAEKNGLAGSIQLVEILPIAQALEYAYKAEQSVKNDIHEITGISDIIRGQTEASETATAQQIKGQYASLRLKTYQEEVARFATDILQIMAQVMCGKFNPQTLLQISAAEQLSEQDKALVPQALALLVGEQRLADPEAEVGPNPLRSFRVEVAADTLVYLDEQAEKESRVEFLTAVGGYLEKAAMVGAQAPQVVPLLMELLKFGVTGFKVGKNIEGVIDEAVDTLKKGPTPIPPEVQEQMMKAQAEVAKAQDELKGREEQAKGKELDLTVREGKLQVDQAVFDADRKIFAGEQKMAEERLKMTNERGEMQMREGATKIKGELEGKLAVAQERMGATEAIKSVQESQAGELKDAVLELVEAQTRTEEEIRKLAKVVSADRETTIELGPDGRKRGRSRVVN